MRGWQKYDPNAPPYVNTLSSLGPERGFWVHTTEAATLVVTGNVAGTTQVGLQVGWNLVGYPSAVSRVMPDALSAHGVGVDYTLVYAYHAGDTSIPWDPWKLYDRTMPGGDLVELEAGWGYWIRATAVVTWQVEYR